jgi:hypothetical protein
MRVAPVIASIHPSHLVVEHELHIDTPCHLTQQSARDSLVCRRRFELRSPSIRLPLFTPAIFEHTVVLRVSSWSPWTPCPLRLAPSRHPDESYRALPRKLNGGALPATNRSQRRHHLVYRDARSTSSRDSSIFFNIMLKKPNYKLIKPGTDTSTTTCWGCELTITTKEDNIR